MIFKNEDKKHKMVTGIDDADSFWDVSGITPPKRIVTPYHGRSDTEASVVEGDVRYAPVSVGQPIPRPSAAKTPLREYSPDNPLISRVSVYGWHTKYSFYEKFASDARRYFDMTAGECCPVKFFSYMPGYVQMSLKQREWYFYWRDCVRKGQYLPVDSSYILLYIYEIINLPDLIPPKEGLVLMCDVWEKYRESYTKLDKFLSEWVCDYCLVHGLEPPIGRIVSFCGGIPKEASLRQFYLTAESESEYAALLLERLSSYNWRKSKYITDGNRAWFEKYIDRGFSEAVKTLASADGRFDGRARMVKKTAVRDAFSGALCIYACKRRLEVEYYETDGSGELGFIVTDMVRYCENRVRAYLGIRPRLGVQNLSPEQRIALDGFFDRELPCVIKEKKKNASSYEEAASEERKPFSVSFDRARAIEESSWRITDRLVEELEYELEEAEYASDAPQETEKEPSSGKEAVSVESETLDVARIALGCIAAGDQSGFLKLAEECFMLPDTLAEVVNELCYEIVGDIGIEENDVGYGLISDYEEEIRQWLNS